MLCQVSGMMEKKKHREKESIGSFLFLFRRSLLPPPFLTLDLDPPFSNKKTQAKSGMGKTAVFVLSVLQQLDPVDGEVGAIVICHTRELAYQICHEFERFSVYLPGEKERREEEEIFFSSRFERSGQRSEEAFYHFL